jgi:hypothetical protein
MRYTHKTYNTGFTLHVTPKDREVDALHYVMFGTLLGGRSLEGVVINEVPVDNRARNDALRESMCDARPLKDTPFPPQNKHFTRKSSDKG